MLWAADNKNKVLLDLEGSQRRLARRVTWPSFGNAMVYYIVLEHRELQGRNIVPRKSSGGTMMRT
jgi:ATP-dependent Zn protease